MSFFNNLNKLLVSSCSVINIANQLFIDSAGDSAFHGPKTTNNYCLCSGLHAKHY